MSKLALALLFLSFSSMAAIEIERSLPYELETYLRSAPAFLSKAKQQNLCQQLNFGPAHWSKAELGLYIKNYFARYFLSNAPKVSVDREHYLLEKSQEVKQILAKLQKNETLPEFFILPLQMSWSDLLELKQTRSYQKWREEFAKAQAGTPGAYAALKQKLDRLIPWYALMHKEGEALRDTLRPYFQQFSTSFLKVIKATAQPGPAAKIICRVTSDEEKILGPLSEESNESGLLDLPNAPIEPDPNYRPPEKLPRPVEGW